MAIGCMVDSARRSATDNGAGVHLTLNRVRCTRPLDGKTNYHLAGFVPTAPSLCPIAADTANPVTTSMLQSNTTLV